MPGFSRDGRTYVLDDPLLAPTASAFLWNRRLMIQATCRGFATAQFMQPEPAKYAHAPVLAAKTFMQPEPSYFAHHPGRFFYVRDDDTGALFSTPYEPVRAPLDRFEFVVSPECLRWCTECQGLGVDVTLSVPAHDAVELWTVRVRDLSGHARRLSVVPYFPVGYASWMNQGGAYSPKLWGVVCRSVTPYQRVADYFVQKDFKDITALMGDRRPDGWEANQARFEGESGLRAPAGLRGTGLEGGDALYEVPACIMQYRLRLEARTTEELRFVFGPARDEAELQATRQRYLEPGGFENAHREYVAYLSEGRPSLVLETPDREFDHFVNHWLARQVDYHGRTHRLTTDPQTRNYLQDAMGMAYLRPDATRTALLTALSQQHVSGAMPDGILLSAGAQLKYINQIPHTDHCVWLPICLESYLDETGDLAILDVEIPFDRVPGELPRPDVEKASVREHLERAMVWLVSSRDHRGLSHIAQGDWCDPMNMVGYQGRGVSAWLTQAVSYALGVWARILELSGAAAEAQRHRATAETLNRAIDEHFWDGEWYARGITDAGTRFGTSADREGRVFLNAQSWAMLCGAATPSKTSKMLQAVDQLLDTPYGVQVLAPPFTGMREDIGRVTQKFPGSAENGSVYNHAAAFFAFALFRAGLADRAFSVLRRMIPGPEAADVAHRGQLPVFVPNYYRGAFKEHPRVAGRSSQLFNTGSAAWFYRLVSEYLFGLRGEGRGVVVNPRLPATWPRLRGTRRFRGATFELKVERTRSVNTPTTRIDGERAPDHRIASVDAGRTYTIEVELPDLDPVVSV